MLSTGSEVLDDFLNKGFKKGAVSAIFGPATSGKTTTALMTALQVPKEKKVIFLDTEGGFSPVRLQQLAHKDSIKNILVLKISSFQQQSTVIKQLEQQLSDNIGLIVCDTISALFRKERSKHNTELNQLLKKQVATLAQLAKKHHIPVSTHQSSIC